MAVRDFSKKTLEKISKEIDDYFGSDSDGKTNWIQSILYKFGVYKIHADNVKKNYEKYVKSLGTKKAEVIKKIEKVLKNVSDKETTYNAKFKKSNIETNSINNIVSQFSDTISFKNFSIPYDFDKLDSECAKYYTNLIESRARTIIEKDSSQWTDEEIEIVSYAYTYSSDEKFKEKVINSFYTKSTDKHYSKTGLLSGDDELGYNYYDRDKKSWEKFLDCNDQYFIEIYNCYLDGKIGDAEFNQALKNHMTSAYLNDEKYNILVFDKKPVSINENGDLKVYASRYKKIEIRNGKVFADGKENFSANSFDRVTSKNELSFKNISNDEDASNYLKDNLKIDSLSSEEINYEAYTKKLIAKAATAVAGIILPGSGKVVSKAVHYAEIIAEEVDSASSSISTVDALEYETYIRYFDLKLVHTSNGLALYLTPNSLIKIKAFIAYIEANKKDYSSAYDLYVKDKNPESYVNGDINISDFLRYIDDCGLDNEYFG